MREHLFEPLSTASWRRPESVTWQPSDSSAYNPCERTRARDASWIHERTWWSQCCGRLVCVYYTVCCLFRSQERRHFLETKPAVVIINRDSFVTVMQVKCPSESPWHAFSSAFETETLQRLLNNSCALKHFLKVTLRIKWRSSKQTLAQKSACTCIFGRQTLWLSRKGAECSPGYTREKI